MTETEHVEMPIQAAKYLAERYGKSMVVILSYDPNSQLIHVTTYGVAPDEKCWAADVGDLCAKLICGSQRRCYEDFRYRTQAQWATERERLHSLLEEASSWIKSYKLGEGDRLYERISSALGTKGEQSL